MRTKKSPYRMRLSLNVLNHLGINLYSNVPAVLAETVANAWDADAEHVWVYIDEAQGVITITDDGHGMNDEDINAKFLMVGYRRRDQDPAQGSVTAKWKRLVMGRKGIGKLSLFSIARDVQVFSVKSKHNFAFEMKLSDIQAKISGGEGTYEPPQLPLTHFPKDLKKGTRIVLRDLKKGLSKAAAGLRVRLARRFSIIGLEKHFQLYVNDEEVTVMDRGYFGRLQYLWYYGEDGERAKNLSKKLDEFEERPGNVTVQWP
jgi:hypothetical protein